VGGKGAEGVDQWWVFDAQAGIPSAQVGGATGDVVLLVHRRRLLNGAGEGQTKGEDHQRNGEKAWHVTLQSTILSIHRMP
jgi:hypothetical protein